MRALLDESVDRRLADDIQGHDVTTVPDAGWAALTNGDQSTSRLAPSVFVDLPVAVRMELERRGCTIPQPFSAKRPENVVKGRFTSSGQTDWAVLCSRDRTSPIFVLRTDTASPILEIPRESDRDSLQVIDGNGTIGFSRALRVADAKYIRNHHRRYGSPTLPPIDHDGIIGSFIEKASVVWYWYQERWLILTGAD